jgi:hypothetical protein
MLLVYRADRSREAVQATGDDPVGVGHPIGADTAQEFGHVPDAQVREGGARGSVTVTATGRAASRRQRRACRCLVSLESPRCLEFSSACHENPRKWPMVLRRGTGRVTVLGGRLGRVDVTVRADDSHSAEREAHDRVMPLLSRMAVEADAALEVKATVITELSTHSVMMGADLLGAVKPAPEFSGLSTPEQRPLLPAYWEGLNCNMPSLPDAGLPQGHRRGDAVAGAAGDLGGGDPGIQPQGHGGVAEVVGAAGQR